MSVRFTFSTFLLKVHGNCWASGCNRYEMVLALDMNVFVTLPLPKSLDTESVRHLKWWLFLFRLLLLLLLLLLIALMLSLQGTLTPLHQFLRVEHNLTVPCITISTVRYHAHGWARSAIIKLVIVLVDVKYYLFMIGAVFSSFEKRPPFFDLVTPRPSVRKMFNTCHVLRQHRHAAELNAFESKHFFT